MMSDDEELSGRERYQVRRKPGKALRVVDRRDNRIDGYWYMEEENWFDARNFIDKPRYDYLHALNIAFQSVPGHANATRHRECSKDREKCMDSISVGDLVISRG